MTLGILLNNLENLPDIGTFTVLLARTKLLLVQAVTRTTCSPCFALPILWAGIEIDKVFGLDDHGGKTAVNVVGKIKQAILKAVKIRAIAIHLKRIILEKITPARPNPATTGTFLKRGNHTYSCYFLYLLNLLDKHGYASF